MKYLLYVASAMVALAMHGTSHALACVGADGNLSHTDQIQQNVAVPLSLPKDSILWRSETRSIQITCWKDQLDSTSELAYAYLNPYDDLGEHMELGITLNGMDYRKSQMIQGRVPVDSHLYPKCGRSKGCKEETQHTFQLTYSYFVSKKSGPMPEGSLPEGPLTPAPPAVLVAFQLDGVGGMNWLPDSNFQLKLEGLSRIRYVNCGVTMRILPNQINFATVMAHQAQEGALIEKREFFIEAEKECQSASYGLDIVFNAAGDAMASDDRDMLIPKNNQSVGIRIVEADSGNTMILGTAVEFAPESTQTLLHRRYEAELRWAKPVATIGEFSAGAMVDFYYK